MNHLMISGVIASGIHLHKEGETAHGTFDLCVRHLTKAGKAKKEYFKVNTWNGMATWAKGNLQPGQMITVGGYLVSRPITLGDATVKTVEICAKEIMASGRSAALSPVAPEPLQASANMSSKDFSKRISEVVRKVLEETPAAETAEETPEDAPDDPAMGKSAQTE